MQRITAPLLSMFVVPAGICGCATQAPGRLTKRTGVIEDYKIVMERLDDCQQTLGRLASVTNATA
jgi:hypothetical protein